MRQRGWQQRTGIAIDRGATPQANHRTLEATATTVLIAVIGIILAINVRALSVGSTLFLLGIGVFVAFKTKMWQSLRQLWGKKKSNSFCSSSKDELNDATRVPSIPAAPAPNLQPLASQIARQKRKSLSEATLSIHSRYEAMESMAAIRSSPTTATLSSRTTPFQASTLRIEKLSSQAINTVIEPNAMEPYAFENDFVRGKLLFLLKSSENGTAIPLPSKYSSLFTGRRRLFWVQMQVQFKQEPSGIVYIGGEVPQKMQLGFFTNGLTKLMLSVLQSLVRGLHYSFGSMEQDDEELPHICFPLYTAVDQFVVTKPGEEQPVLGSADFGESPEAAAARRKSGQAFYRYNTSDVYSFHFHSYVLDFERWKVVNVPGMKDMDLSAFWSNMPLRIVAYSLKPSSSSDETKIPHTKRNKEYQICVQLSHDSRRTTTSPSLAESSATEDPESQPPELRTVQSALARFEFSIPAWVEYFSSSSAHADRRVAFVFVVREFEAPRSSDENQSSPKLKHQYIVLHSALEAFTPLVWIEHEFIRRSSTVLSTSKTKRRLEDSISILSSSKKYAKIDHERLFLEQMLVELMDRRIVTGQEESTTTTIQQLTRAQTALLDLLQRRTSAFLRNEWTFLPRQPMAASAPMNRSSNPSPCASRSNSFRGESTSSLNTMRLATDQQIVDMINNGHGPSPDGHHDDESDAIQVLRVVDASMWRHEWLIVDKTRNCIRFFRTAASASSASSSTSSSAPVLSTAALTIPLDRILVVEEDNASFFDDLEFASNDLDTGDDDDDEEEEVYWLRIGLLEKCHYVGFNSPKARQTYASMLLIRASTATMETALSQPLVQTIEKLDVDCFASETSLKSCGAKRIVLNTRSVFVLDAIRRKRRTRRSSKQQTLQRRNSKLSIPQTPCELLQQCLEDAIALQSNRFEPQSTQQLIEFMDQVSQLQWVSIDYLKTREDDRKAFFLNLFHVIVVHGALLGLLPKSKSNWSKFFNGMTYHVGGMFFSPAEIEHCILRAPMASVRINAPKPMSLAITWLLIPKPFGEDDDRMGFRLTKPDVRLNFALNCRSQSCPNEVLVFGHQSLDWDLETQLNDAVTRCLEREVGGLRYDRERRVVYLPKICEWYRPDFVASDDFEAILRVLLPYLHPEGSRRRTFEFVLENTKERVVKWRFAKYDYHFHESIAQATTKWTSR